MPRAKKLLITNLRRDFYVLRQRVGFELFCKSCDADREFVSLADSVLLSGETMREIVRQAETNKVHFLESLDGHLFICRQSLSLDSNARLLAVETRQTNLENNNEN